MFEAEDQTEDTEAEDQTEDTEAEDQTEDTRPEDEELVPMDDYTLRQQ